MTKHSMHRPRDKSLGTVELVAIALGGMVGGGIFSILGIAVAQIGPFTPVAIVLGGIFAGMAAYSYVKLGVYYRDEGATYAFIKRSFPGGYRIASLVGWWVIFGYISTLALYAYTFASYAMSGTPWADNDLVRKLVAGLVIGAFTLINVWSVRGMGKLEDIMVYTKLAILLLISIALALSGETDLPSLVREHDGFGVSNILIVAAITFVAYEGFQLVINASGEMENPRRQIPRAIYTAIMLAILIYVVIAIGALMAIPFEDIMANEEYALAAGASDVMGPIGFKLVVFGALLATSSAISGTVFGASRQMAAIAADGFMPSVLAKRRNNIPVNAIIAMSSLAFALVLAGDLRVILEFGSVTFLIVSLMIAITNFRMRRATNSSVVMTTVTIAGLALGSVLIIYFEATTQPEQLVFIGALYAALSAGAWLYATRTAKSSRANPERRDI